MKIDFQNLLSKDNLELFKSLSQHSYGDKAIFERICAENEATCEFIEDTQTDGQVFVISSSCTIIVFRGTSSFRDFLTDFNLFPVSTPFGRAHGGFVKSFLRLWPHLKKKICGEKPLIITGHSLGGALAQLCALWANHDLNFKAALVVTYGQPRIGSFKLAKIMNEQFNGRYFRIVRKMDIVARVPFYFIGYVHAVNTGRRKAADGGGEPLRFFDRYAWEIVLGLLVATLFVIGVLNHGVGRY